MMTTAPAPVDYDDFQRQVEIELQPLYLKEKSPLAALRARSRSASSVAWLGPVALVGALVLIFLVVWPLVSVLQATGLSWVAIIVLPIPLIGFAVWLGRRRKAEKATLLRQQQHILDEIQQLDPENLDMYQLQQRVEQRQELSLDEQVQLLEEWETQGKRRAAELLAQPRVRAVLCPHLREELRLTGAEGDIFHISRATTSVLLDALEEKQVTLPVVPVLFAAIALHVYRRGIEKVCQES
jgi:hypothetical protein